MPEPFTIGDFRDPESDVWEKMDELIGRTQDPENVREIVANTYNRYFQQRRVAGDVLSDAHTEALRCVCIVSVFCDDAARGGRVVA